MGWFQWIYDSLPNIPFISRASPADKSDQPSDCALNQHMIADQFVIGTSFLKLASQQKDVKITSSKVKLRADPLGHILYWLHDISFQITLEKTDTRSYLYFQDIVDVRLGPQAQSHVKDPSQRFDEASGLIMTVVTNVDFTHPTYTTFAYLGKSETELKEWSTFIMNHSYKVRHRNHGFLYHVQKSLAPAVCFAISKTEKGNVAQISVEKIVKALVSSKSYVDKQDLVTKVTMLNKNGFVNVDDIIDPKRLMDLIINCFIIHMVSLKKIFFQLAGNHDVITRDQFLRFVHEIQRDPRKNELLHPLLSRSNLDRIFKYLKYPTDKPVTFKMFVHYLWSDYGVDSSNSHYRLNDAEMDKPITHYHINSSHNSYCSGLQLKMYKSSNSQHSQAKADVEMYRQILLSGCRCIELDVWDGSDEPMITHGPTHFMRMNEIKLTDVCHAIQETAFKTSPWPVILSIENHLKLSQQKKMVEIFQSIFKDQLLTDPLDTHPLIEGVEPPSPLDLQYKIIVKAKKGRQKELEKDRSLSITDEEMTRKSSVSSTLTMEDDLANFDKQMALDELSNCEAGIKSTQLKPPREEDTSFDLSKIVNYFETDKPPKDYAAHDGRYYVMCSLNEESAMKLFNNKSDTRKAIRFTSKKMTRVYPSNWRITSDNFDPMKTWLLGIQMVALNFQTNGQPMLLNHAFFERNGGTGYILKSKVLTDPSLNFDPHNAKHGVQQMIPTKLRIKVLSGLFLSSLLAEDEENLTTVVTVELLDIDRKSSFTTKVAQELMMETSYEEEQMTFGNIMLSELAFIHFTVHKRVGSDNIPIAHRILMIDKLNNGYRNVILRSVGNRNMGPASLLILFDVSYDMPKHQEALRNDLADPFANDKQNDLISRALADPLNFTIPMDMVDNTISNTEWKTTSVKEKPQRRRTDKRKLFFFPLKTN